jgi:hypothetical protein
MTAIPKHSGGIFEVSCHVFRRSWKELASSGMVWVQRTIIILQKAGCLSVSVLAPHAFQTHACLQYIFLQYNFY